MWSIKCYRFVITSPVSVVVWMLFVLGVSKTCLYSLKQGNIEV